MARKKTRIEKINYTSRDFDSIKESLVAHAARYYPDTYKDFNAGSFGSLMLDSVAYVGDILSFYVDYQANESFLETAIEPKNVLKLARTLNYQHDFSQSSYGIVSLYVLVPAQSVGLGPDLSYIPILQAGTLFSSTSGVTLTLTADVDFGDARNSVVVAAVDNNSGQATSYAIKAHGSVVTGFMKTKFIDIGDFQRFLQVDITDLENPVADIMSVTDTNGNEYFQVNNLSQDIVYRTIRDHGSLGSTGAVAFSRRVPVPRRFVVEKIRGRTVLQFGHGSESDLQSLPIADPSTVALRMHGKKYVTEQSFDPTNLMSNDKMGVSPSNTTLRIVYRASQKVNSNLPVGSVSGILNPLFTFKNGGNTNILDINSVKSSLQVTNETPIVGSENTFSVDEIKVRAKDNFFSQNRAVTREDYVGLVYRMPKSFGTVARVAAHPDPDSMRRNLNLFVLSSDENQNLITTPRIVKSNIRNWLLDYKMVNDTIDILDGKIINIAVSYSVVSDLKFTKFEMLQKCNAEVQVYMAQFREFGEPLYISDIYKILNSVHGVVDTKKVDIVLRQGGTYAPGFFDISNNTVDGRYIVCPRDSVFELKFPDDDIVGSII